MANRVKYGLKSVYYAVCTVDATTNVATYGTPKPWPGAVSLSLDAEGGTTLIIGLDSPTMATQETLRAL